jgi:uncharacterized membrane protein YccC
MSIIQSDSAGSESWDPALWSIGTVLGAAIVYLACLSWRTGRRAMSQAKILQEKAEMFERRAESATDPISKQHYKEMAAHYRSLAVEHLEVHRDEPAH